MVSGLSGRTILVWKGIRVGLMLNCPFTFRISPASEPANQPVTDPRSNREEIGVDRAAIAMKIMITSSFREVCVTNLWLYSKT